MIVLVLLALRYPRQAVSRLGRFGAGLAWALAPFAALAGYPLVFSLVGAQHVAGSAFTPGYVDIYRNDLLSPIVPTTRQLVAPGGWAALGNTFVPNGAQPGLGGGGPGVENGAYLGIPLVAGWLAATTWATVKRNGFVLACSIAALVAFVLSLGTHLTVHGHTTGIPLPFDVLSSLPVADFDVPARFSLICDLALVLALGAACEAWLTGLVGALLPARRRLGLAGAAVLCAAALVPLLPSGAEASASAGIPAYFSSGAVRSIPPGAVVLAYPYPLNPQDQAMLWQVASGFRFRLIGGYVLNPFRSGQGAGGGFNPPTLDPATIESVFEQAYGGDPVDPIPVAPWSKDRLKAFVRRYHVDVVVVDDVGAEPGWVSSFLTGALHERPTHAGSVEVWHDVQNSRLIRPAHRRR